MSSAEPEIAAIRDQVSTEEWKVVNLMDDETRRARGLAVYKKMGWGENEGVKDLDPDLWKFTTDVLFGEIWARPGLSLRERELITLGVLMAAKADGIAIHMRNAHHLGITFDEIKEVILQCTIYLGMPKALFAMRKLKAVMAEEKAKRMD